MKHFHVAVDETSPVFRGGSVTADGIKRTLRGFQDSDWHKTIDVTEVVAWVEQPALATGTERLPGDAPRFVLAGGWFR